VGKGRKFAEDPFELPNGQKVGFSFKVRNRVFNVVFRHPSEDKYIQLSTGCTTKADAYSEAARLILTSYGYNKGKDPRKVTWEEAVAALVKLPTLRHKTLEGLLTAITNFRRLIPTSKGPHDVTVTNADQFHFKFSNTSYSKSPVEGAKTYIRSKTTVHTNIRMMKILWNQQFRQMGFVGRNNPWDEVDVGKIPKTSVSIPTEQTVSQFFKWIGERYPEWELIRLFFDVKALSGCRLMDLCKAKSCNLDAKGMTLTIPPEDDKTATERVVPLPLDTVTALNRLKGKTWLWEQYPADAKKWRWGTKSRDEFTPQRLANGVKNIAREFTKATNLKVKSHDFRRRAITLFAKATGSADAVQQTFNLNPATARKYYVASESLNARDVLAKMADILRPKG
jgi:integrase